MDLSAIKTEIAKAAYNGMTDAQIVAALNVKTATVNRDTMSGSEVLNAVVASEWSALSAANKQLVWDTVHLGTLNPFGVEATLLVGAFGAGSATITALAAARVSTVPWYTTIGGRSIDLADLVAARSN